MKERNNMAFDAFDPRKTIRTKIGTNALIGDDVQKCISVTGSDGTPIKVPMYTREYVEQFCPPMPFILLDLLSIPSVPHDILAAVREKKTLIGLDITFKIADNINVENFGKDVADAICNLVRTNQSTTNGIWFYNIHNEGQLRTERDCEELKFHWILELEAIYNDAC